MPLQAKTYLKMLAAGVIVCIGGPALVIYLTPDPDELFKKYNPELQKKALAERETRLKQHEEFLAQLREYSKSDKPIWLVAAEEEKKRKALADAQRARAREEMERQRQDIMEEQQQRAR
ncbi:hypothetical protein FN846DRAFT_960594 [Sphaerosporella brunnea]|uniref:Cytochrome b mRNA-processing protein 4 n=1 Tax=Sphaerosporella brunnea TaxID=1250544 RepID=A0A5J5EP66_9PEZI|nr:hypothetical protein FN846DRAFT_960594 [Sphaerosporella brunnea]